MAGRHHSAAAGPVWLKTLSKGAGVVLTLAIQPKASRTEVVGEHGDALKIRIAAPPVDGAANDTLLEFLAKTLRVSRRDICLVRGAAGRRKIVEIVGVDPVAVARVLTAAR